METECELDQSSFHGPTFLHEEQLTEKLRLFRLEHVTDNFSKMKEISLFLKE